MRYFSLLLFFFLFFPMHAFSQDASVKVHAGSMLYEAKKNTIEFKTQVFVETDEFYLWADYIIVHLSKDTAVNTHAMAGFKEADIKRIEAIGNVCMEYGDTRGFSGKALYDFDRKLISLQENPLLEEGNNSIEGNEILYYLEEDKSEVIGGQERVRAVFSGSLQNSDANAINDKK